MLRSRLRTLRTIRSVLLASVVFGPLVMAGLSMVGLPTYMLVGVANLVATLLFPVFINRVHDVAARLGPAHPPGPWQPWAAMLTPGINLLGAPAAIAQMGHSVADAVEDPRISRRIGLLSVLYGVNVLTPFAVGFVVGFPLAMVLQGFASALIVGFVTQLALEPLEEADAQREPVPLGSIGAGAPVAIKTT